MGTATASLTAKATSGVAWSAVFQISRQLLSVVSVAVLARHVPPSAYGIVAMAAVLTGFLENFRDLGTTNALVREPELDQTLLSTVFWLNCILGLLIPACMIGLSVPAAKFFHESFLAPVVRALSLAFCLNALAVVPTVLLSRAMAFRKLNLASLAGAVAGTVVAIVVAIRGGGVWSLVLGTLTNTAATTGALWFFCPWRLQWIIKWKAVRSIASYTLHLSGFNVVNYFSRNADNLIVGRFLGTMPLGLYQMAYNLMMYPLSNFSQVICQVLFPGMSKLQDDDARFRRAYLRTCMLISLVTFPAMLGLTVTAQPFVTVMLGKRWLPVSSLLIVFGPVGMVQSISTTVGLIYGAKGRADWMFRWGVLSSTLFVISFFLGLPWGIMGVATSYAMMYALLCVPTFAIAFHLIDLSLLEFFQSLWPVMKASLAMAAIVILSMTGLRRLGITHAAVQLITGVVTGAISYIALVLHWKPPALGEFRSILEQSGNSVAAKFASYLPDPSLRLSSKDSQMEPVIGAASYRLPDALQAESPDA